MYVIKTYLVEEPSENVIVEEFYLAECMNVYI